MRIDQQSAFVLHQRNYSETSLLVELFTPEHGRLTVLAKGARRPSSPFRGVLKPFQPLLVGWVGRSDLPILTTAEVSAPRNTPDGAALYCGFYLNELLCRLMHRHDPHPRLFQRYDRTLAEISDAPLQEATLRLFEMHLLREIGYGPVLDHDVQTGESIAPDVIYDYLLERGPVRLTPESGDTRRRGLRVHGDTLLSLANEVLDSPIRLQESKRLMRVLLAAHLGTEPLHSRRLMHRVLDARARVQAASASDTTKIVSSSSETARHD